MVCGEKRINWVNLGYRERKRCLTSFSYLGGLWWANVSEVGRSRHEHGGNVPQYSVYSGSILYSLSVLPSAPPSHHPFLFTEYLCQTLGARESHVKSLTNRRQTSQ